MSTPHRALWPVLLGLCAACSSEPSSTPRSPGQQEDMTTSQNNDMPDLPKSQINDDMHGDMPGEPSPEMGGAVDMGAVGDMAQADMRAPDMAQAASRCQITPERARCDYLTRTLQVGLRRRDVHYQLPVGEAPQSGWPVALLFQGSLYTSELFFDATPDLPHGAYYQAQLVARLLERGFAVLAPEVRLNGSTYWDTNIPPYSFAWTTAPDHDLMVAIFDGIAYRDYGELDESSLYASGISSGGYMTSRMAVSYPGRFKALAINAASYATCGGSVCVVPDELPEDHPPTAFLHGQKDRTVPISTMHLYADRLEQQGVEVQRHIDEDAGHDWLSVSPGVITDFFLAHP